jgi:hypothetical protein
MSLVRALAVLLLLGVPVARAQDVQQGGAPVKPANAAPATEQQPNMRTDAQPRVSMSARTDSAPAPESLGADATPYVDLGPDWSQPARDNMTEITKEIVTSKKGVLSVRDISTLGVQPLPVTDPPVEGVKTIMNIPDPPVKMLPTPLDPLSALPQPDRPVRP